MFAESSPWKCETFDANDSLRASLRTHSIGQELPINGAGQFAPKQPFAGGAVRAGEGVEPGPRWYPRAVSQLLQARQPDAVLPDAAPLSRSFSRLAGRPAFLRHVAGGAPNSRLKARLKAASDS